MGAPYEMNGAYQTGDVYKCLLSKRTNGNGCAKLNLGAVLKTPLHFYKSITKRVQTLTGTIINAK